jgi:hypothetical protein
VLSLCVHIMSLTAKRPDQGVLGFILLHVGIFVVWFPAVLVAQKRVTGTARKDYWKAVLRGAPDWMRYMVYGFLFYAMLNFMYFMSIAPEHSTGDPPPETWRGFSGHWMAFYSAAMAILYAAARSTRSAKCLSGHAASVLDKFCTKCGQPVRVN